jgi:hypothetical protein
MILEAAVEQQRDKDTMEFPAKHAKHAKTKAETRHPGFTRQVKPNKPSVPVLNPVFVPSLLGCSFINCGIQVATTSGSKRQYLL